MQALVQKYGGTSVATIERISHVADHIADSKQQNPHIVVVVSAMGSQTDSLISMAHELSKNPSRRELDMLLTVGERTTMALLSIALNDLGHETISLTGSQSGIITDDYHGNARIINILGDRIQQGLEQKKIVIVAGFQGVSLANKDVTTLGRGGSDLTAIAIARRLGGAKCELYKDVDGIFTADPRLVAGAHPIDQLNWQSLTHLTWNGSGVVHARGAHLAQTSKIPLEIRSSFNLEKRGTVVRSKPHMEAANIKAIAHADGLSWVEIKHNKTDLLAEISIWLWQKGTHSSLNQQHNSDGLLTLIQMIPEDLVESLRQHLKTVYPEANVSFSVIASQLSSITLVGEGFWQEPEILQKALNSLKTGALFVESKNDTITLIIKQKELKPSIEVLHKTLITDQKS